MLYLCEKDNKIQRVKLEFTSHILLKREISQVEKFTVINPFHNSGLNLASVQKYLIISALFEIIECRITIGQMKVVIMQYSNSVAFNFLCQSLCITLMVNLVAESIQQTSS